MFGRKKKKCQHNVNDPNTTVKLLDNFKTMVVPDTKYGVCVCCGKSFEFKENGAEIPIHLGVGMNATNKV